MPLWPSRPGSPSCSPPATRTTSKLPPSEISPAPSVSWRRRAGATLPLQPRPRSRPRVGHGFRPSHRFGPGDHLMLGGVAVPHAQGVVSHSDGDVVLHAIVDALLGAIAAGDIGTPLSALRRGVARRRVRALRGPRAQAPGGALRPPQPRGCHGHLPAAQDRPAPGRHAGATFGCSGPGLGAHQPQGDHDGEPWLHAAVAKASPPRLWPTVRLPIGERRCPLRLEPARPSLRDPAALIATCFGAGLVRWAPGTVASALALPFAWLLRTYTGTIGLAIATLVLIVIGIWAASAYERRTGTRDSSAIVIDEVAGPVHRSAAGAADNCRVCGGLRAVPPVSTW